MHAQALIRMFPWKAGQKNGEEGNRRGGVASSTASVNRRVKQTVPPLLPYLLALYCIPKRFHFGKRNIFRSFPFSGKTLLQIFKSPFKLQVCRAQTGFRIQAEFARQIRHNEEQIAELIG